MRLRRVAVVNEQGFADHDPQSCGTIVAGGIGLGLEVFVRVRGNGRGGRGVSWAVSRGRMLGDAKDPHSCRSPERGGPT